MKREKMRMVSLVYVNHDYGINMQFEMDIKKLLEEYGVEEQGSGMYLQTGHRDMNFTDGEYEEPDEED